MPTQTPDPRCRARKHDYGASPGPGASCARCGKQWQPPFSRSRAPAAPSPPATATATVSSSAVAGAVRPTAPRASGPVASEADAAAFAAALGAPVTPEIVTPGAGDAEGDAAAQSFWSSVAPRMITAYVSILEVIMEKNGREPGEPDEADIVKAGDALTVLCMRWFGPVLLSPGKQLIVSCAFIGGQMWATGKKIEKPTASAADAAKAEAK